MVTAGVRCERGRDAQDLGAGQRKGSIELGKAQIVEAALFTVRLVAPGSRPARADHRLAVLPLPGYAAGQRFKGE